MDTRDALTALLPRLGRHGVGEAVEALDRFSRRVRHDWQRTVVQAFADSIERNGPDGVRIAQSNLELMLQRKTVDLNFVDLRTGSDLLYIMQNAEIDRRNEVQDFMKKIGKDIGIILRSILRGLI